MASRRFLLASFLALLVMLVLYLTSSKMEYKESKMLQMFSEKEDVGLHSMEFTPDPFQTLTNSKL